MIINVRLTVLSIAGVLFLLSSCSSPATEPAGTLPRLPVGQLDNPRPGETVHGVATVRGWALSEVGIKAVNVYLDRHFIGSAALERNRPELAVSYPQFPDAAAAGFEFALNTVGINEGPHELTAQAVSKDGAVHDVGTVTITIAP